jgi:hypothetical protein
VLAALVAAAVALLSRSAGISVWSCAVKGQLTHC